MTLTESEASVVSGPLATTVSDQNFQMLGLTNHLILNRAIVHIFYE